MDQEPEIVPVATKLRVNWLSTVITCLFVGVITGLGIALAYEGSRVRKFESELARLRAEAGHLKIYDRSKVYAVAIESQTPNEWAWRIYLPGNHTFQIYGRMGRMPRDYVLRQGQKRLGSGWSGSMSPGENVLRFRLQEGSDGQWTAKTFSRAGGGGKIGSIPPTAWLVNHDWEESSDVPTEGQCELPPDATFELLRLRQESAVDREDPESMAETFVLWISGSSANNP
jgi:hypothetical protein